MEKLPDEKVTVKISTCPKCDGTVRVAIEHEMDKKDRKEFAMEAMEHNLNISHLPLLDYRKENPGTLFWCDCPPVPKIKTEDKPVLDPAIEVEYLLNDDEEPNDDQEFKKFVVSYDMLHDLVCEQLGIRRDKLDVDNFYIKKV